MEPRRVHQLSFRTGLNASRRNYYKTVEKGAYRSALRKAKRDTETGSIKGNKLSKLGPRNVRRLNLQGPIATVAQAFKFANFKLPRAGV